MAEAETNEKGVGETHASIGDLPKYILKLFVMGSTPTSVRALINVRRLCEDYLKDRYDLEIVDLTTSPQRAKEEQLLAAPTLIKTSPLPVRRFIGDMERADRILRGLDIIVETNG